MFPSVLLPGGSLCILLSPGCLSAQGPQWLTKPKLTHVCGTCFWFWKYLSSPSCLCEVFHHSLLLPPMPPHQTGPSSSWASLLRAESCFLCMPFAVLLQCPQNRTKSNFNPPALHPLLCSVVTLGILTPCDLPGNAPMAGQEPCAVRLPAKNQQKEGAAGNVRSRTCCDRGSMK